MQLFHITLLFSNVIGLSVLCVLLVDRWIESSGDREYVICYNSPQQVTKNMNDDNQNNPVVTMCGGKIKDPSLYPTAEYKGKTIYFCTESCRQAFHTDPDRFMAGEIEHPLD